MRVLLDTSVLLAGVIESHSHHEEALVWLQQVKSQEIEGLVAALSLAELYAALTALPLRVRLPAPIAWRLIEENILADFEVVTLSATEHYAVLRALARNEISGEMIQEALIARAAAKANVEYLITLHPEDFRLVWPQGASKILALEEFLVRGMNDPKRPR